MKNLQILQVVLVFAGLLIVHTSAVSLNLVGTWTDDCSTCVGGSLYICVDDNGNFDGAYSEIGRVFGTIVGNNATGIWFEAGFNDYNSGGFSWRLSDNATSFQGEYWYNSDECVTFAWNAAKLSSEAQPDLCKSIANSRDVGGVWVRPTVTGSGGNDTLYVCVDRESHYVSSLELADNSTSYFSWGRLQQSGRSSAGTWYTSADSSFIGIEMLFLRSSDELDSFSWNLIHPNEAIPLRFNEVGLHGSSNWERIAEESPFCRLNSNLAPITSWEGVWTDSNFGKGRLYLCREENSTTLTGIYSEFGYIESEVTLDFDPNTNRTVENAEIGGTYYDGGGRSRDSGPFNLTLASDGYSFSGSFTINGLTGVGDWAENRLDVTNYFSDSCYNTWNVTTNVTITGSYVYGPGSTDILDICFIKDPQSTTRPYTGPTGSIIASYEFANGQKGYMVGYYSDNGRSMQVHQYTKGQVRTVAIARLTDDATLNLFHWDVDNGDEMIYRICGDTTSLGGGDLTQRNDLYWNGHFIDALPRVVSSNSNSTSFAIPSISKCQRNQKLFFVPVTQSVVAESPSSTSAAGSSVYSVSFVSFVLASLSSLLIAMLM